MVKINLIGMVFGTSGYVSHTRQLAEALIKINADTKIETQLINGWELMCSDSLLQAIKKPLYTKEEGAVTVYIGMPQTWASVATIHNNGFYPYLVWEGDKIPKSFEEELKYANKIIVPSEHTKKAILNTVQYPQVIETFISVVPHGVDLSIFKETENNTELFTFVGNKGWAQGLHDRGGIQFLIKAFADEFKVTEKVQLRLKINPAYFPPGFNLQNEMNKLQLPSDCAPISVNPNPVPYKEVFELYREADVFVSPTMAEAFSIPCAEAMACGLPVMTTGFGGQTDYVDDYCGWLIPYSLVDVRHDWNYEGIKWALPDYYALRKFMREAFNNRELCKQKGKEARKKIQSYSWENSAKKLLETIETDLKNRKVLKH